MLITRVTPSQQPSEASPTLWRQIQEALSVANESLQEHAAKLSDFTLEADWKVAPNLETLELILQMKSPRVDGESVELVFSLSRSEFSPEKVRRRIWDAVGQLAREFSARNQRAIARLFQELLEDRVLVAN